jgi:hypothetical protein
MPGRGGCVGETCVRHPGLLGHRSAVSSARSSLSQGSGFSLLHSSPYGQCETESDKDCGDTADVTPRSGVVRKDQRGNKPKVEPDRSTGVPEDAPAGSAAGGEHSGDGLYRGVLRIIRPPVRLSRRVRSANLAKQGDDSRHQQRDSGERGEDKWGPRHAGSPGWECPGVPPVRVSDKRHDGHGKDGSEQQIERQDDGGGDHGRR